MKKLLLAACASILALPALAALEAGKTAPAFTAKASLNGEAFDYSLTEALSKGPVVVYFYPSAYTQGCSIQARQFAEKMESFNAAGATVIGVSLDSIERLNEFSADPEYCAGKLAVASDKDGWIAKSYDIKVSEGPAGFADMRGNAIAHGFAERVTFVVAADGRIAETIGGMSPVDNVQKALEAVQKLK